MKLKTFSAALAAISLAGALSACGNRADEANAEANAEAMATDTNLTDSNMLDSNMAADANMGAMDSNMSGNIDAHMSGNMTPDVNGEASTPPSN